MYVCLPVRHNRELCKNVSTDVGAVWDMDLGGSRAKEPYIMWGPGSPQGKEQIFWGVGGCSCQFVVNYRACLVCNRYSQRYLVDGNGDAYFYVCCYSCMYAQDKCSLLTYLWSALLLWYAAGSM